MTRQETGKQSFINFFPEVAGKLAALEVVARRENFDKFDVRKISAHIKFSLLGLGNKEQLTSIGKKSIANAAEMTLISLRKNASVYSDYARMDILAGIGEFEDPNMQLVIAKSLDDSAEEVRKLSASLLARPSIEIFPGTFKFLLNAKDPKNPKNYDPEKTELALSIVEKNEKAGVWIETVDVTVGQTLLDVLLDRRTIEGGKYRAAVIAGKLHSRTPKQVIRGDQLMQLAIEHISFDFFKELERISSEHDFDQLVDAIRSNNLSSARIADDIPTMALVSPPEHETIGVLLEIFGVSGLKGLNSYRQIRALAAQEARKMLQKNIADEREEAQQKAEQKRDEDSRVAEQRKREREISLRAQRDGQMRSITEERNLADAARNKFYHLR